MVQYNFQPRRRAHRLDILAQGAAPSLPSSRAAEIVNAINFNMSRSFPVCSDRLRADCGVFRSGAADSLARNPQTHHRTGRRIIVPPREFLRKVAGPFISVLRPSSLPLAPSSAPPSEKRQTTRSPLVIWQRRSPSRRRSSLYEPPGRGMAFDPPDASFLS